MEDHAGFSHAMDVRTERIDEFPVVFHYGEVRHEETTKLVRDVFQDLEWRPAKP